MATISALAVLAPGTPVGPQPPPPGPEGRQPGQHTAARADRAAAVEACRQYIRAGRPQTAIEILTDVVAEQPAQAEATLLLARAYLANDQPGLAEDLLEPALTRFPKKVDLLLAWVDVALARRQWTTTLRRIDGAHAPRAERPAFQYRAARAYFGLDQLLGDAEVRTVAGGRAGQFVRPYLLVESHPGVDRFLCAPRQSAMYQIRQALDSGFDDPAAHVLHARIWHRLGRPQVGLSILRSRAAVLLARPDEDTLAAFSDLAVAAGDLPGYLRYERWRAAQAPSRRDAILLNACLVAAERYSQRGEETLYIEWLRRAADIRPNDADILLNLADAEWDAGRHDEAARVYRKLLSRAPSHPQRRRILARLAEAQVEWLRRDNSLAPPEVIRASRSDALRDRCPAP